MPKYYFNVRKVSGSAFNETYAFELEDDEAARREAGSAIAKICEDISSLVGTSGALRAWKDMSL